MRAMPWESEDTRRSSGVIAALLLASLVPLALSVGVGLTGPDGRSELQSPTAPAPGATFSIMPARARGPVRVVGGDPAARANLFARSERLVEPSRSRSGDRPLSLDGSAGHELGTRVATAHVRSHGGGRPPRTSPRSLSARAPPAS